MSALNIKKIAALVSAAAVMSSLAGCGKNATWGAQIDGEEIPAGIFIYYLQSAYYDAQTKVNEQKNAAAETAPALAPESVAVTAPAETQPADLYSSQIDGVNAKDWIYDEATRQMQEYQAVESKFEEYGLTLSEEAKDSAQMYINQLWEYGGEYYTQMGISESSYKKIYLNMEKRDMLFEKIYSEGGEKGVPEADIKAYLTENYAMINYIDMELKDGEGNLLKSDGKDERKAMAMEYIDRYNEGDDFDELNAEYVTYYKNLQEAAEEAAAQTAEVEESDAKAPLEGEGDTLEAEEDTAATEAAETDPAETEAATEAATEAQTETVTAASEETAAAETAAPIGAAADSSDTKVNAVESNQTVVEKESTTPAPEVVAAAFEMSNNEVRFIESTNGEHYYVVLKMDILEGDEYYTASRSSLLYEMKSEDYDELVASWTEGQAVTRNAEAYKRYDPAEMVNG